MAMATPSSKTISVLTFSFGKTRSYTCSVMTGTPRLRAWIVSVAPISRMNGVSDIVSRWSCVFISFTYPRNVPSSDEMPSSMLRLPKPSRTVPDGSGRTSSTFASCSADGSDSLAF